jgi:hypothetical protein
MYVTWAAIDGNDGESAEDFEARSFEFFMMLLSNGHLELSTAGVELLPVTDRCDQVAHDKLAEAIALVAELDRYATYCEWIKNQLSSACNDEREDIMSMIEENEPRIEESRTRQIAILDELFDLGKSDGISSRDVFIANMMQEA